MRLRGGEGQLTTLAPRARAGRESLLARAGHSAAGLDWVLLAVTAAITAFGLFVVKAATRHDVRGAPSHYYDRQLLYVLVGVAAMVVVLVVDVERLARVPWALWGALCGSIVVVLGIGSSAGGATRWISLGPFQLQPSELGKVALGLVLAGIVVERSTEIGHPRLSWLLVGVVAVPAGLVFLQPDLGTALVYAVILAAVLFVAGVPWTHFATFGAIVAVLAVLVLWAAPQAGIHVLKSYQVDRLTSFTGSTRESSDQSFQRRNSATAIGNGGGLGKGPDGATQTNNRFIPEHRTDFIFAPVGEMFGFAGAAALILAYGLLLWRGLRLLARVSTQLDQLVVAAIVAMFAFEVFVNIGMTIGIMPVTGIPLLFMSYGGSHTLANLIAIGILLRIHSRRAAGPV